MSNSNKINLDFATYEKSLLIKIFKINAKKKSKNKK